MSAIILKIIPALFAPALQVQAEKVVWPFYQIGNFIENTLLLLPYWGVKTLVILFFLSLAAMPFFFSKDYIFKGADDRKPWRDLRYWALAAAVSEVIVYLYF